MTIPNVSLNDSVKVQNNPAVVKQNATSIDMKSSENLQRQPQEDNFNGKGLDKKKIITYASIGTVLATLVGIALDFRFAEGKHVKNLWRKLTGNTQEIKPKSNEKPNINGEVDVNTPNIPDKPDIVQPKPNVDIEPPKTTDLTLENQSEIDKSVQEFFEQEEKELAEIKQAKELSDWNNDRWLNEQHHAKEKEYSDFWNKELEKAEQPLKELKQREIQKLQDELKIEKLKFIEENKNNLPPIDQRYNEVLRDMRTEYGGSFTAEMKWAKHVAKTDIEYLEYAFEKSHKYKELALKLRLTAMKPDEVQYYKEAEQVLMSRKLNYDRLELASLPNHIIKSIAKNEFGNAQAIGHGLAYQVNGALRLGVNPEDIIITLLDESFKSAKPLTKSTVVYRGVTGSTADNSIDFINKLMKSKKGDTFIDKGYSFTSFNPRCAVSCNGTWDLGTPELKLTIKVPKGAKISDGSDFEQLEMLFPRNAEFKIVEEAKVIKPGIEYIGENGQKCKGSDYVEMVVEYILPKS